MIKSFSLLLGVSDINKASKSIEKVLRNAASSEGNNRLQSSLFIHAQKYETLDSDRDHVVALATECEAQIEESKAQLVNPIKVVNELNDYQQNLHEFTLSSLLVMKYVILSHLFESILPPPLFSYIFSLIFRGRSCLRTTPMQRRRQLREMIPGYSQTLSAHYQSTKSYSRHIE
jgi:hypothetical protein